MSTIAGANLTETYTSTTLLSRATGFKPGSVYFGTDGKVYQFVQYDTGAGSVAAVAGNVCYYYAPSGASAVRSPTSARSSIAPRPRSP